MQDNHRNNPAFNRACNHLNNLHNSPLHILPDPLVIQYPFTLLPRILLAYSLLSSINLTRYWYRTTILQTFQSYFSSNSIPLTITNGNLVTNVSSWKCSWCCCRCHCRCSSISVGYFINYCQHTFLSNYLYSNHCQSTQCRHFCDYWIHCYWCSTTKTVIIWCKHCLSCYCNKHQSFHCSKHYSKQFGRVRSSIDFGGLSHHGECTSYSCDNYTIPDTIIKRNSYKCGQ